MPSLLSRIKDFLASRPGRYLVAGAWNTAFGYSIGVALYLAMSPSFHIVAISVVANVIAITMSFVVYKLFVFQTKGGWLREYARSYAVYGVSGIFSIGLLWLLVDRIGLNIWLGQALAMVLVVLASYLGHANFTFGGERKSWRRS